MAADPHADGYLVLVSQGLTEPPSDYDELIAELQTCSCSPCRLPLIRSGGAVVCIICDRAQPDSAVS